ncbi:MAG TPA: SDR family oxidoreductase [Sphingobium sp.]
MTTKNLFDLSGRMALVTGAAQGIGAAIAEVLAEAGAEVIVADVNEDKAQEQAAILTAAGHRAAHIALDVGDEASIVHACAAVTKQYGAPWLLVNNAALQDRELLINATVDNWDRLLNVNARGPFLMSREIARAMIERGVGGRIVNIASCALIGALTTGHSAYASSKAALVGLTRATALELLHHGITVNTLMPGGVLTPGAINSKGPLPEGPGMRLPPLGLSDARDMGPGVLFFASPAAHRVTNQTLSIDAGWSLS